MSQTLVCRGQNVFPHLRDQLGGDFGSSLTQSIDPLHKVARVGGRIGQIENRFDGRLSRPNNCVGKRNCYIGLLGAVGIKSGQRGHIRRGLGALAAFLAEHSCSSIRGGRANIAGRHEAAGSQQRTNNGHAQVKLSRPMLRNSHRRVLLPPCTRY